ncbi:fibrinogen-like YCDxxxxGGGW domain-containing protein [Pseudoalteromonas rubra]|uniref:Fibrinogen C-terminal domain-containing protein n=1 Tax=Pseudoalteromonas rubra TaxID=43658 RepID=A0A0F4QUR6_9GAMM|nr:fibrinogen-like YCDxxxxGGGW domain-containing protein [Pseudoalteromonas rubra]KJZ11451.1 hypothetical protein TW77_06145 [Pseudoalteromonas rubra]
MEILSTKLVATAALASVFTAQAGSIIGDNSKLEFDRVLDGQLIELETEDYVFAGKLSHFIAEKSSYVVSGNVSTQEKLIHWTATDKVTSEIRYFTGALVSDKQYAGVWFSNTGEKGDWQLKSSTPGLYASCNEILKAGVSNGDGVYDILSGGETISVYCDMTNDGGGWTLLGAYAKNTPGGKAHISEYAPGPGTEAVDPQSTWLFQGDLGPFFDVREQVACSSAGCAEGKSAYGTSMTTLELENIRYSWGYEDRASYMPTYSDVPACRRSYVSDEVVEGCMGLDKLTSATTKTVVGWQTDIHGTIDCWVARGNYASSALGSARCFHRGGPDGSRWALLWMR